MMILLPFIIFYIILLLSPSLIVVVLIALTIIWVILRSYNRAKRSFMEVKTYILNDIKDNSEKAGV
jgi:ABC-type multidrug transport system fused ATPase/permease subunit